MEAERHQHGDERQQVDVLPQRRNALGDRNQAGVEPDGVGDDERGQAEQRVRRDVERDEQPVVAPEHQRGFHLRRDFVDEALAAEPFGVRRIAVAVERRGQRARDAVGERRRRRVRRRGCRSCRPRPFRWRRRARARRPASAGLRLDGHDAEVFFARQQRDRRVAVQVANLLVGAAAEERRAVAAGAARSSACALRAVADDLQRDAREPRGVDREVDALVRHERRHDERVWWLPLVTEPPE